MTARLEIWGVEGLPEIAEGDDIATLIIRADPGLQDLDVVVVTSKIVSKAEGRLVAGSRDDHLVAETTRVVARRGDTQIVETRHGFVLAAAGIDASNVPDGTVALLPLDPDASAGRIRAGLRAGIGVDVAVIVSDTMGRPWRDGVVDTAIGAAGIDVRWDLRGQPDTSGRPLEATLVAIADELASAADLVKGKLSSTPVAVIRGFPFSRNDSDLGARPLVRSAAHDMFRLGTREAMRQVVLDSTPAPGGSDYSRNPDPAPVARAVAALGAVDVTLSVSPDGSTVIVSGDPLTVGIAVGRLLTALAAEDLRGQIQVDGGTAVVHVVRPS